MNWLRLSVLYIITVLLLIIGDMPWLATVGRYAMKMVEQIQDQPIKFKWWAAAVVYLALGYLVMITKSITEAGITGAAVYAVYDFTNLATFTNYSPLIAVADSIWGGILFAGVKWTIGHLDKD
jgi:uncharacterized membrane protein